MALSLDYLYLQANQSNSLGGLAPTTDLKNKELGHEITVSLQGLANDHFTLLSIVSTGTQVSGHWTQDYFIL